MRVTQSVAFGLVSLVCTVNANVTTAKPVLAKRQVGRPVTVSQDGCTAVCEDIKGSGYACEAYCDQISSTKMPATSTYTSTLRSTVTSTVTSKATSTKPSVVSQTTATSACYETCSINEAEGDFDCNFSCDVEFPTAKPVVLDQRTLISAVQDDCTAVCWDLMPGTECDVQCSSDFKTAMPVSFAAPSKAARIANLPAREDVQAHRVHEARLARKFGGVAVRDHTITRTLWPGDYDVITSTIGTIDITIMPLQVRQTAEAPAPPGLLSQASAALSAVQQWSPTFASALSVDSTVKVSTTATATATAISTALETTTASATSSKTATAVATVSETTTALVISSETTTATTTAAPTSPETSTALAIVSETITELVTSSKTMTATADSPKTTTTAATESETTTASVTTSKTTTKSSTASKTTTKSVTASKTTTKSITSSETITASTTKTGSGKTFFVPPESASKTVYPLHRKNAASGDAVPGLVLPILVGLAVNAGFLI